MAHLSGTYTYTFSRLDPMYNNSLKTGVQSLVVGLNCQYSGLDENGVSVVEGAYIDGTTGFSQWYTDLDTGTHPSSSGYISVNYTPEYVSGNISGLANEYVSGLGWLHQLEDQIYSKLHTPIPWSDFPFPHDGIPPVNPEDE